MPVLMLISTMIRGSFLFGAPENKTDGPFRAANLLSISRLTEKGNRDLPLLSFPYLFSSSSFVSFQMPLIVCFFFFDPEI